MNLDIMQDMLNELNAFFKVFVYPDEAQVVLRVFNDADESWSISDFRDILFDMNGEFKRDVA